MSSDWKKISLDEITLSINTGLDAIRRAPILSHPTKIRCLRIQDISQKKPFNKWGFTKVKEKDYEKYQLLKNDIIMARTCSTGISYLVKNDMPAVFNNGLARVRLNLNIADPNFIFYTFQSNKFVHYISGISGGTSVQLNMKIGDLAKYEFHLPRIEVQKKIAQKLSTIDQKIQLNNETNQTLEAIAQALFKSWFVDFDPVKAKAEVLANGGSADDANRAAMRTISGKTDAELEDMATNHPEDHAQLTHTASLFPDKLVDSELGDIPEGWEVKPLDKVAHYQNGLALQKFRPEQGADYLPIVKIAQLKSGQATHKEKAKVSIKPECIIDNGDVVFSWSGSLLVDIWCGGKAALNQHLFKVTSADYPKWFYHFYTKHHLAEFQRIAQAKAVTMGHIKREHLRQALCAVPMKDLDQMGEAVANLLKKQIELRLQNQTLTTLRDTLLPKLLSGELDLNSFTGNSHD